MLPKCTKLLARKKHQCTKIWKTTSFSIIKPRIDMGGVQIEGKRVHVVTSILSIVDEMHRGLRFVHLVKRDDQLVGYKFHG